jgi:uncharacterized membrane protein
MIDAVFSHTVILLENSSRTTDSTKNNILLQAYIIKKTKHTDRQITKQKKKFFSFFLFTFCSWRP